MSEPNTSPSLRSSSPSDDHLTRYVVVTDPTAKMNGWPIRYHQVDGESASSDFAQLHVDKDESARLAFRDDARSHLRAATIGAAALSARKPYRALTRSTRETCRMLNRKTKSMFRTKTSEGRITCPAGVTYVTLSTVTSFHRLA